jgi:hypothetical protein
MSELNTNIDEYTVEELLQILYLDEDASPFLVNKTANEAIEQFRQKGDMNLMNFLKKARDRILSELQTDYTEETDKDEKDNKAVEWYKNQYLPPTSRVQGFKITDRVNQVETFPQDGHFPMKQNMLGVNNAYQLPVAQDVLNPTLRNFNTSIINLDSQFRNIIYPFVPNDPNAPSSSTNYTIDLTEPLNNVLALRIYSVQIPNTWYRFGDDQGNACFFVDLNGTEYKFVLPNGNYTSAEMVTELNDANNWTPGGFPVGDLIWYYNDNTAKFEFTVIGDIKFYLYDAEGKYVCNPACINITQLNQNLGWSLGFRVTNANTYVNGLFSTQTYSGGVAPGSTFELDAAANLYGPKYFAIVLDDFNQNRQNTGLINIGPANTKLSYPSYYAGADLGIDIDCSNNILFPTLPRRVTQAQIYSINQIRQNRKLSKDRTYGTNNSDVMAILPLDINANVQEKPYTTFGANLLLNERRYFGPVNISKMKLRLIDDKGNTVNLNGADWVISLVTNELYQY